MNRLRMFILALALICSAVSSTYTLSAAQYAAGDTAYAAAAPAVPGTTTAQSLRRADPTLPARTPPPRTLRDHWHVFVAFGLAWILLFGYTVSLGRRFARVEHDLRTLQDGVPTT